MIVVSGITGKTGAATARHLLSRGEEVVGLSRKPDAVFDGARTVQVDLADTAALTDVLRGAKAFYVLLPPQWGAPDLFEAVQPLIESISAAIDAADVPRVVVLSSIAAQQPEGTGPIRTVRILEEALADRPGVTFLRPAYFLQNLGNLLDAVRGGQLPTFWDPAKVMAVVDTDDIGAAAADLLVAPDAPRIVQLAGPRDVSFDEVASAFSVATGTPVKTLALPATAMVERMQQMGAGHLATLYAEMNQGLADGIVRFDAAIPVRRATTPLQDTIGSLFG